MLRSRRLSSSSGSRAGASRPFLKLGISKGFTYTYDPNAAQGERIIGRCTSTVTPIDLGATYSVTVNSFLATGGDNFTALSTARAKQDTGRTDLQAQVDYFAAFAQRGTGLSVDFSQRAVGVTIPSTSYSAGGRRRVQPVVAVDDRSAPACRTTPRTPRSTCPSTVVTLGSFPVTTTIQTALPGYDEAGTATAVVTLPIGASGARTWSSRATAPAPSPGSRSPSRPRPRWTSRSWPPTTSTVGSRTTRGRPRPVPPCWPVP